MQTAFVVWSNQVSVYSTSTASSAFMTERSNCTEELALVILCPYMSQNLISPCIDR
jgi:hypothetical protein